MDKLFSVQERQRVCLSALTLTIFLFFIKVMLNFITYTTGNYTHFTSNLLNNFDTVGLSALHHMIVVCLDSIALENLKAYQNKNWATLILWDNKNLALYADFGTTDFILINNQKIIILKELLPKYDELYYVDSDIVFFKDPEPIIRSLPGDIVFQQDAPYNGHADRFHTYVCSGNFVLRNTPSTRAFLDKWVAMLTPECNEQGTLYNYLKSIVKDVRDVKEVSINVFPMEMAQNGYDAFKFGWHTKPEKVCIHANHMVGSEAKINALKSIGMWSEK